MKKSIFLAQSMLLSSILCNEPSGPIAREFKKLEEGGGTTTEFIATVEGRAEQVAKELDRVRFTLDAFSSEGAVDAWSTTRNKLTFIAQLAQSGDKTWLDSLAGLVQEIPTLSDPDSNIHGNMQIMFEVGNKPTRTLPENVTICAPEKANYVSLELELIPVRTDQTNIDAWTKTVACLIEVIKKVSNNEYMKDHAVETAKELGQLFVECHATPDSGVRMETKVMFYEAAPAPVPTSEVAPGS